MLRALDGLAHRFTEMIQSELKICHLDSVPELGGPSPVIASF
jgi:hypothetical protein